MGNERSPAAPLTLPGSVEVDNFILDYHCLGTNLPPGLRFRFDYGYNQRTVTKF
jgi:hypothetical protein